MFFVECTLSSFALCLCFPMLWLKQCSSNKMSSLRFDSIWYANNNNKTNMYLYKMQCLFFFKGYLIVKLVHKTSFVKIHHHTTEGGGKMLCLYRKFKNPKLVFSYFSLIQYDFHYFDIQSAWLSEQKILRFTFTCMDVNICLKSWPQIGLKQNSNK